MNDNMRRFLANRNREYDSRYDDRRYSAVYYEPMTGYHRVRGFGDIPMPIRNEMSSMYGEYEKGYADGNETCPAMDRRLAEEWCAGMMNSDGTTGAHWDYDKTTAAMEQRGIDCDAAEFYAVMNSLYSDFNKVFTKYGMGNNVDFYCELTRAWLNDADAVTDKASSYYCYVVRH